MGTFQNKCLVLIVGLQWHQAIAATIIVLERPRTASMSLLLLFATILVAQMVVLSHAPHVSHWGADDIPSALVPIAALAGIVVVLNMPMRDPMLPNVDISPVYGTPTVKLRTPEDNLTPWQYMTVAWMSPLIQEGYKRQLDDDDVWDLPYTFKHEILHRTFRRLRGSVTRRVFAANGMDLVRTTIMALVRLAASKIYIAEVLPGRD
jgi:hypothetical protein